MPQLEPSWLWKGFWKSRKMEAQDEKDNFRVRQLQTSPSPEQPADEKEELKKQIYKVKKGIRKSLKKPIQFN